VSAMMTSPWPTYPVSKTKSVGGNDIIATGTDSKTQCRSQWCHHDPTLGSIIPVSVMVTSPWLTLLFVLLVSVMMSSSAQHWYYMTMVGMLLDPILHQFQCRWCGVWLAGPYSLTLQALNVVVKHVFTLSISVEVSIAISLLGKPWYKH
jgi:hypothetical protein